MPNLISLNFLSERINPRHFRSKAKMSRSAHKTRGVRTVTPDPGLYAGPEFSLRMFTVLARSNKPPQVVVIDRADPGTDPDI